MIQFVAYFRVSTARQGMSGLGLEAQQAAVQTHLRSADGKVVAEYREVETGKKNARPQLQAALRHVKRIGGVLLVAKLDRLGRNAAFLLNLMEAGVPFICCDNPHANELTLGLMAIIAQHEAKLISERTIAALQAAKARGVKLGSARDGHWLSREGKRIEGCRKARARAIELRKEAAIECRKEVLPLARRLQGQGMSQQQIADRLNAEGWRTPKGHEWNKIYVGRLLKWTPAAIAS